MRHMRPFLLLKDAKRRRTYAAQGKERRHIWAGGYIGRTVARAFARDGAKVFLAGRTLPKL